MQIASLPVGGGTLSLSPMPGRNGAYAADLAAVLACGPALVLTLTPVEELIRTGAARLPQDLAQAGIAWAQVPVADYGVPEGTAADLWPQVAGRALAALGAGGRVLVHCMGGCGRSGMVALRLMVLAGEAPAAALTRLRAARPCAVETAEQMAWGTEG